MSDRALFFIKFEVVNHNPVISRTLRAGLAGLLPHLGGAFFCTLTRLSDVPEVQRATALQFYCVPRMRLHFVPR